MMRLFKKPEKKSCCEGKCNDESMQESLNKQSQGARIKVLGSGCAKCMTLEENTKLALNELGQMQVVDHVTDFSDIASYGVMSTPALVVDGVVVSFGKVLSKDEVIHILNKVGF
ncbi:MAG: thioredoxin family protein [Coprobacillus sp.]